MSAITGATALYLTECPWEASLAVADLLHGTPSDVAQEAVKALAHAARDMADVTGEAPAEVAQRWARDLALVEGEVA